MGLTSTSAIDWGATPVLDVVEVVEVVEVDELPEGVAVVVEVEGAVAAPDPDAVLVVVVEVVVVEVVDVVEVVPVGVVGLEAAVETLVPFDVFAFVPPKTPNPQSKPKANKARPNKPTNAQIHLGHLSSNGLAAGAA